jgi:hypothetical protein
MISSPMTGPRVPVSHAWRKRRARRGAVLLEAIVVITAVIVFFVGMIYLHQVYDRQLQVIRAAHAAGLAYATHGCQGANNPSSVLAPGDARPLNSGSAQANVGDLMGGKVGGSLAGFVVQAVSSVLQFLRLGLPSEVRMSGSAVVTGPLGDKGTAAAAFQTTVRSSDLVLCNDIPMEGSIPMIFEKQIQSLGSLL